MLIVPSVHGDTGRGPHLGLKPGAGSCVCPDMRCPALGVALALVLACAAAPSPGPAPAPQAAAHGARAPAANAAIAPAGPAPAANAANAPARSPAAATRPPVAAAASCVDDAAPYDAEALRARIAALAAPTLDGRAPGSPGDAAARAMLVERFRCLGLTAAGADGSYEQPFEAGGRATANVVGYIAGDAPGGDVVVVAAHHDHLGDGHLGANDNASGAAALLAIPQAVRQGGAPHRTIAFALFGGEELGLVGSRYFAAHPPAALPLARIVYDVNLDMIGSYAQAGAVYAMGTFRGLPAAAILRDLARAQPGLHVALGGRGEGSDHEAFCAAGIPYAFFWTPDRRCYHARCDTLANLDLAHAAQIAARAGALVRALADSPLDLAASRARLGCAGS